MVATAVCVMCARRALCGQGASMSAGGREQLGSGQRQQASVARAWEAWEWYLEGSGVDGSGPSALHGQSH